MLKDRIKKIRLENGMTQSEFAKELGVTQATVSGWERGLSEPEEFRMKYIADQGDMTISDLEQTEFKMLEWIEEQIGLVKIEKIVAGDEYTLGRLDILQEIEALLNSKERGEL